MALWLVRAGKYGEHETRFFEDNRIYLTWGGLEATNLSSAATYDDIKALMQLHLEVGEHARDLLGAQCHMPGAVGVVVDLEGELTRIDQAQDELFGHAGQVGHVDFAGSAVKATEAAHVDDGREGGAGDLF